MALKIEDKQRITEEVAAVAAQAKSVVAVDYHGITANQMTELRKQGRQQDVCIRVVKNSLARRALEDTPFACLSEHLSGPIMFAFSLTDVAAAARIVNDLAKEIEAIEVKLISLDGELHDISKIKQLAELPTYEQAVSLMMAVMKAPLEKLVRTIKAPVVQAVQVVDAVRSDKDKS
ncbi:MAG: 50S ribosomal protein L10 [Chromatiales bacterium]|nr:50S ribosomal protein L10 [Chromatiales bacterium]